ncbi:MAG: diacylglycerol/lipid kinase family protein [Actinomycetota bacterium]
MTARPVVVVANPTAGRGKAGRLIGKADAILHDLRVEHEVRVSESGDDLEATVRHAAEDGAGIVAVLGGDGTVSLGANGVLGTGAALAILPAGTGDDFAKVIGAGRFDAAVRLLANPKIVPIDLVSLVAGVEHRHFVNIAGAGFDSEVNETANGMSVRLGGTGTYVAAIMKTLSRFSPAHYELTIDGEALSVDAMLTVVGSGIQYGGGMKVLPHARVNDGLLDVCIVEALGKTAFLRAFPRVFTGSHGRHPKVRMMRGTTVTVEANRKMLVYADGERVGPLPATFEVRPGALSMVVGPDARGIG